MGGERIEVLAVETDADDVPTHLDYQYSITQKELNEEAYGVLNSIVAVDINKFYMTRFKPYPLPPYGTPVKGKWNSILRTLINPTTYVLYCEYAMPSTTDKGELACRKVADGFMVANGLTTNWDKSLIYVGDAFAKSVSVYSRHTNNSLELVSAIDTKVGIDNLKFDEQTGNIYAGSLANM